MRDDGFLGFHFVPPPQLVPLPILGFWRSVMDAVLVSSSPPPVFILGFLLFFRIASSSSSPPSSCSFIDPFCSLLHERNVTLCPDTLTALHLYAGVLPALLLDDKDATYRAELMGGESKETLTVRIWDPVAASFLRPLGCDFLYKFKSPVHQVYPLRLSGANETIIDLPAIECSLRGPCNSTQHDAFAQLFKLPSSVEYDIFYSLLSASGESVDPGPPDCLKPDGKEDAMAWDLQLMPQRLSPGSCHNISLLSFGYMHGRKFDLGCLGCQMVRNSSSRPRRKTANCTCSISCTDGPPTKALKTTGKLKIIGVAVCGAALFGALLIFTICCCRVCFKKELEDSKTIEVFLEEYTAHTLKRYKYSDLKNMTTSFSDKLGQGGYSRVFKGNLEDGRHVAVKLLNEYKGNGQEFINEVACIGRANHINIVTLIGFCSEGSKRALVYEFMSNGSLEKFLSNTNPTTRETLQWEDIYKIVIGIAKGLEYLHKGCTTRVVHFDIKPHNILLDEDFNPRISDFGLAKLCPSKDSVVSMNIPRGTIGYIAPEVFSRGFGVVSSKSDVYSYGMLVLEMVGVRNNMYVQAQSSETSIYFPHWIYEQVNEIGNLNFNGITTNEYNHDMVKKMILIGLWCIQTNPTERPSISKVVEMFDGKSDELVLPPKPYLFSSTRSFKELDSTSML